MAEGNQTNRNNAPTEAAPGKKRILCVDDDPHMNDLLDFWLAQNGYDVTVVASQTEALGRARREWFDLYLLDD
jgi:CheY-like chemotaxis protein